MDFKILVVDDEAVVRDVIQRVLSIEGYQIKTADCGKESLILLESFKPDLVLLDLHLDDMNGMEILSQIKGVNPEILIIIITAFPAIESAVQAMKEGAYDYIQKPFMVEDLILTIRKAFTILSEKRKKS